MARRRFGSSAADWVVSIASDGALKATIEATLTAWDARTGGTQVTDLLDADDQPIAPDDGVAVVRGQWTFYGPDDVTELWVDAGGTERELVVAEGGVQALAAALAEIAALQQQLAEAQAAIEALTPVDTGDGYLTIGA